MKKKQILPDVLFEVSWEVCNMVGGIYTVLSTKAKTVQEKLNDNLLFIGPDLWKDKTNPLFVEDTTLHSDWVKDINNKKEVHVRIGRWKIPGKPLVILVDFEACWNNKDAIYTWMWNNHGVDSLHGYGDYDESSMFSYASGKVAESFYTYYKLQNKNVAYHAHEWMTGMGALYLQVTQPKIATLFTTHATSVGRSIAGNYKPLYDCLPGFFGDQMAEELNVQSKHSIEKCTANAVDCFTTVSEITAIEANQLLECKADVVVKNGFENDFVPKGPKFTVARNKAKRKLIEVAEKVLGTTLDDDTLIVGTSGRYELKNKGLDVFVDAINALANNKNLKRDILAYIFVPAWVGEARQDLKYRLLQDKIESAPLKQPFITHWLHQMDHDDILSMMQERGIDNSQESKVKLIFVPCYLDGKDGIFNMKYYDLLIGQDITVYPSYYEPWGYTPLESIAFKIPTITTNLSGFGRWSQTTHYNKGLEDGVVVLDRTDTNYSEVVNEVQNTILEYSKLERKEVNRIRNRASLLADRALWKEFISAYYEAYTIAFQNRDKRLHKLK